MQRLLSLFYTVRSAVIPLHSLRYGPVDKACGTLALGLCVGHDSLFYQYSEARVTTLVVKDRVLAHNPVGAIYCADGYFKNRLKVEE